MMGNIDYGKACSVKKKNLTRIYIRFGTHEEFYILNSKYKFIDVYLYRNADKNFYELRQPILTNCLGENIVWIKSDFKDIQLINRTYLTLPEQYKIELKNKT